MGQAVEVSLSGQSDPHVDMETDHCRKLETAAIKYCEPATDDLRRQAIAWLDNFQTMEDAAAHYGAFLPDITKLAKYLQHTRLTAVMNGYADLFDSERVTGTPTAKRSMAANIIDSLHTLAAGGNRYTPADPNEVWKIFSKRNVMTRREFDVLVASERRRSLTAAGMSRKTINTQLRDSLLSALDGNITLGQFKAEIADIVLSPAHAETIYRTNVLGAYNDGHLDAIYDPDMKTLIPAFRFVAIMDSRTTDICEERHDQIYSKEDAIRSDFDIFPPCHYNCRSIVVPVTMDDWNGLSSPMPQIRAMEGFGHWTPDIAEQRQVSVHGVSGIKSVKGRPRSYNTIKEAEPIIDFVHEPFKKEFVRRVATVEKASLKDLKERAAFWLEDGTPTKKVTVGKYGTVTVQLKDLPSTPGAISSHTHPPQKFDQWAENINGDDVLVHTIKLRGGPPSSGDMQYLMANPNFKAELVFELDPDKLDAGNTYIIARKLVTSKYTIEEGRAVLKTQKEINKLVEKVGLKVNPTPMEVEKLFDQIEDVWNKAELKKDFPWVLYKVRSKDLKAFMAGKHITSKLEWESVLEFLEDENSASPVNPQTTRDDTPQYNAVREMMEKWTRSRGMRTEPKKS